MTSTIEGLRVSLMEPPGYLRLLRFAEQVEQGTPPDPDILRDLAQAFRQMLAEDSLKKRPAVFARAMNLQGKRGNKPPTAAQESPRFEAAVKVFLIDPEGAQQAIGKVASDLNADESTVRKWVNKYRESAQATARWILQLEAMRRK